MPINQRLTTASPVTEKPAIPVITLEMRQTDARGTFDPTQDAYPGSTLERIGVPEESARSVAAFMAFTQGNSDMPNQMRVQDLLAQVRMRSNTSGHLPHVEAIEKRYRDRVRSPLTAIRAFCVFCQGHSPKAATNCDKVDCALWPFHRGAHGLRGKK